MSIQDYRQAVLMSNNFKILIFNYLKILFVKDMYGVVSLTVFCLGLNGALSGIFTKVIVVSGRSNGRVYPDSLRKIMGVL